MDSKLANIETELEQELLGMLLINNKLIPKVSEKIKSSDFNSEYHKSFYKTLVEMYIENKGNDIEIVLYVNKLSTKLNIDVKELKKVIKHYMENVVSTSNCKEVAEQIKRYSICRNTKAICLDTIKTISSDEAEEKIYSTIENLNMLIQNKNKSEMVKVSDYVLQYYEKLFNPLKDELINTGYGSLDKVLCGAERSDLTVIAARPAIGKSSFAVNIATSLAKRGFSVGFFTLEMRLKQIMDKLFASIGKIPLDNIRNHNMNSYSVQAAQTADFLNKYGENFFITDKCGIDTTKIKAFCMSKKLDVIIVDHIGLVTPSSTKMSRNDQVGEITRNLKIMGDDLNAWVICLSQLNRGVEMRANKRPNLSDLRDSGNIEQDANHIIFLSKENEKDDNSSIICDVSKNRFGTQGTCIMNFDRKYQLFSSTERHYKESTCNMDKDRGKLKPDYY